MNFERQVSGCVQAGCLIALKFQYDIIGSHFRGVETTRFEYDET